MKISSCEILLVEDDPGDAVLFRSLIGSVSSLDTAERLKEALGFLSEKTYSVVFLDLNLPDSRGVQTIKAVYENASEIPIIVMTNVSDDGMAELALQEGAQDYLIKGEYDEAYLNRSIRYATERNRLTLSLKRALDDRKELETALSHQRELLTGWQQGSVTASMAGVGPLHQRESEAFVQLQDDYSDLIEAYLEKLNYRKSLSNLGIEKLAARIGRLNGGPKDVIDLHLRVIEDKSLGAAPLKVRGYTLEGRLFALELMGFLADYYRVRACI
ncbi:MAG: response regulator [Desulfobacterales bacterium]|nr:response regulator [Desulfobacterales bacterium]